MDNDDLETTLRHGLQELANDAPRGDGLWETTSGMIAIQREQEPPAPEEKSGPGEQPPKRRGPGFGLGIVVGLLIAAVVAAAVIAVLLLRDSDDKRGIEVTKPKPKTTISTPTRGRANPNAGPKPGPETSALMRPGPIPAADVLFNDYSNARIVVADTTLDEVGLIVPSSDATWRAVQLSPDRTHLFVAKTSEANGCDELWDLDLQTQVLRVVVERADIVGLSPDGVKAVVQWDATCAQLAGQPSGQVAMRDLATKRDVVLPELSGGGQVNVAWSPDGARLAAEPYGTHHVVVYDVQGRRFTEFDRPISSQDGLGWTADGLILVDLGNDKTAVLRTYDSGTGRAIGEIARVPQVRVGGNHGPLVTPQVTAIRDSSGRTFIEVGGGADALVYGQVRVVDHGRARVVRDGWFSREFVG